MPETRLPALDREAILALADLICGNGRPWYKTQTKLPEYFRNAGLDCEEFPYGSGITRRDWVAERLQEYAMSAQDLFKAITRIADTKEHRLRPEDAREALSLLNSILEPDGVKVSPIRGGFVLQPVEFDYAQGNQSSAIFPLLNVAGLVADPTFCGIVQSRFDDAAQSRRGGAYLSSVIMLGSGLEGLLQGFALSRLPAAMRSKKAPKISGGVTAKHIGDWTLSELIDVAHDVGWIQKDAHAFGHNVRDFRNLVHPYKQWKSRYDPTDEGTCHLCWEVVRVVFNDLKNQTTRESLATSSLQ